MATPWTCGGSSQSKKLLKRRSTKKGDQENPYSGRGADKFSALLAEIEEKKRMVYSQFDPEEVSLIRFVHAGNNKLKPVVVRANSSNKLASKSKELEPSKEKKMEEEIPIRVVVHEDEDAGGDEEEKEEKQKKMEIIELGADEAKKLMKVGINTRMSYKVVLVLVLVLVGVLMFGRYYLLQLQDAVCPNIQTQ